MRATIINMKSGKVVGTEEMPVGVHMSVYELLTDYLKLMFDLNIHK